MTEGGDPQAHLRRFAARVAHELNNGLTAIVGLADKLRSEPEIEEHVREQIALIAENGWKLKRLSDRLADFSRGADEPSLGGSGGEKTGAELEPPAEQRTAAAQPRARRTAASLLLVDDEEIVRKIVAWQLEGMGYRVVAVDTAEQALQTFDRATLRVDLVLIDFVLPGLSGLELARELRRRRPDLPLIMLSGAATAPEGESPCRTWLAKPVALQDLKRAVEDALAGG